MFNYDISEDHPSFHDEPLVYDDGDSDDVS